METIFAKHYREIQSLDRLQESQVLQETTQVEQMTSKMVFEVGRLWLHTTTYSGKDKYQSRCFIKERSSKYHERQ